VKLLKDLIASLSSDEPSLTDALMKTKVLLHQLGRKELADWVNSELNGYSEEASVPPYRVFSTSVLATVSNGVYTHPSVPLATSHLGDLRPKFTQHEARESISALEDLVRKSEGQLAIPIPPEFYGILGKHLTETYVVQRAWRPISDSQLVQVLTQVRSRLLDFLLELSEMIGDQMSEEEMKKLARSPETTAMFNHAIFGDNTTILVGNYNRQEVTKRITTGDFESLRSTLEERNVGKEEIATLKSALNADADGKDVKAKRFGPRVRAWMKSMLDEAVDATWQIELGIAGNLLTDALKKYYGW
jgi:hypothetical protein